MFFVEHANHLVFINHQRGGGCNRGRSRHANGLICHARFPAKITCSKDRHDGFFTSRIDHSKLYTAFLNVHDILCGIALRKNGFLPSELGHPSPQTGRVEK